RQVCYKSALSFIAYKDMYAILFFEEIFPEITVIQEILTGVIFGCLISTVYLYFCNKDERVL
ncbi:hypothetical protein, partial [Escherichia coli]